MIDAEWKDCRLVAFDTETSGAYPIGHEIVEIGAVKWEGGKIIDEFQTLLRLSRPMSEQVIKIHGITNEMVEHAPLILDQLPRFREFLADAVVIAHHAPFDLGFLVYELEQAQIPLPTGPILCSSLLARALIPEAPNHRLQTLLGFLRLPQGKVHRALDDAKACLEIALECFRRVGEHANITEIAAKMKKSLRWENYLVGKSMDQKLIAISQAIRRGQSLQITYGGG
ncbi:MAG: exonuclease, partial [Bdellovibrio sp.]